MTLTRSPLLPALLFAAVAVLALLVAFGFADRADVALFTAMSGAAARRPWLAAAMQAVTWLGDVEVRLTILCLVAAALLARERRRREGWFLLAAAGGGIVANSLAKLVFARARPDIATPLDLVHSLSFPSGHAANSAALYLALALLLRYRGAVAAAALLVAAIGLSRVFLAVHWPSDVLAGWCMGVGWLLMCRILLLPPDRNHTGDSAPISR